MDGALMLLVFSAFLSFLVYKMDQNESNAKAQRSSEVSKKTN